MRNGFCEVLKKDQVVKTVRFTGSKNFVGMPKREEFIYVR